MEGHFLVVKTPTGSTVDLWIKENIERYEITWLCSISIQRMLIGERKGYVPQNN